MHYLLIGPLFFYCGLLFILFGDGSFMLGTAAEIFEIERLGLLNLQHAVHCQPKNYTCLSGSLVPIMVYGA